MLLQNTTTTIIYHKTQLNNKTKNHTQFKTLSQSQFGSKPTLVGRTRPYFRSDHGGQEPSWNQVGTKN